MKGFRGGGKPNFGMVKRLVRKAKGKSKQAIAQMLYMSYVGGSKRQFDALYKKVYNEADKVISDTTDDSSWEFWQDTVLKKCFAPVKGEERDLFDDEKEVYIWLPKFIIRLKEKKVTDKDKEFIMKTYIPVMKNFEQTEFINILDVFGLKEVYEGAPDEDAKEVK